jgi:hypothetical protein
MKSSLGDGSAKPEIVVAAVLQSHYHRPRCGQRAKGSGLAGSSEALIEA